MRKLRLIKPWNLPAVRMKTALPAVPIMAESCAQRGPGATGRVEDVVLCRGLIAAVSLRAVTRLVCVRAPHGELPVVQRPR